MIISGARVSSIADISDGLTLPGKMSFRQALGVSIQVRIVKDESAVSTQLINGCAATIAVKEFNDRAVRRGDYRSSQWRWNIDRVMYATFGACFRKRIAQLIAPHTDDRNK